MANRLTFIGIHYWADRDLVAKFKWGDPGMKDFEKGEDVFFNLVSIQDRIRNRLNPECGPVKRIFAEKQAERALLAELAKNNETH